MTTHAPRRPRIAHPGFVALAVVTVSFLAFVLPPYLGLDPSLSRSEIPPAYPWYYPMLVTHIFLDSIALLSACLQLWPWLRRHHPVVHRWVGRTYVTSVVLGGAAILTVTPVHPFGPNVQVANTLAAVLWIATTLAGFQAARQRRFDRHREWMIRSIALGFSIVVSRIWIPLCIAVYLPGLFAGGPMDEVALAQAVGAAAWLSWVVNLIAAEWWLIHTRGRRPRGDRDARQALPVESARPV